MQGHTFRGGASEKPHLLTLGPLKVHVAVTLPALGWRAQFAQSVRLRSFGQANVPERPSGHHDLRLDAVNVCKKKQKEAAGQQGHQITGGCVVEAL